MDSRRNCFGIFRLITLYNTRYCQQAGEEVGGNMLRRSSGSAG